MLSARNRMTRSSEFDVTVKRGIRAAQPDLVVHAAVHGRGPGKDDHGGEPSGPRIGFIIAKSVGSAVQRHRVARRLRHVTRTLLSDLQSYRLVVIRALPGSRHAPSARLEAELRAGLQRLDELTGSTR